jgi:hypothetical protein
VSSARAVAAAGLPREQVIVAAGEVDQARVALHDRTGLVRHAAAEHRLPAGALVGRVPEVVAEYEALRRGTGADVHELGTHVHAVEHDQVVDEHAVARRHEARIGALLQE